MGLFTWSSAGRHQAEQVKSGWKQKIKVIVNKVIFTVSLGTNGEPVPLYVPAAAQNIHEAVREAVRAMRVLPTFSGSPTSTSHCQTLASQRCRPKHKDKPVNVRSLGPRATPPTRKPESPTHRESHKSESALRPILHFSPPKSHPITMDSEPEHHPSGTEDWEPEEEKQGLGYMMMSPHVSQPPDDYVVMASPHKHDWPACSTLQTSINR